jgi:hypothetical protein
MLSPDYLDKAPEPLTQLMQNLEDDILKDVARRIGKMGTVTDTAQWQMWRLEQISGLRKDVVKRLAQYSGKTDAQLRTILQSAGVEALGADDAIYQQAGIKTPSITESPALANLLNAGYRQTLGTWKNLTATTANTVTGQFERALDRAWIQVSSGAFDYQTAIRRTVNDLSQHMTHVTYPSGHRDTLEVATRRAVLTGVNQTAGKLQIERMNQFDWNFVETTAHAGARPEHVLWQGKAFHRGGSVTYQGKHYPDFVSSTGYGSGDGLCGWNCRHNFYPFFPGLSQSAYTQAELNQLNARDQEYNGKLYTKYEISQMQRAAERKVRAAKKQYLAEDAAGLDTTQSAAKLKNARQQLSQFVRDTGGYLDSSRTGTAGFGHSAASKATWVVKKEQQRVAKEQGTAKIEVQERERFTRKQLESMPLDQLREKTVQLAAEWYQSGRSGISFPSGANYQAIANQLAGSASKKSLVKDYRSLYAKLVQLDAERAGKTTTNAGGHLVTILERTDQYGIPNSITQVTTKKNGTSRNYYDSNGTQSLQLSNSDHGHTSESKFGEKGEHAHDYVISDDGEITRLEARELTDAEREENSDIL